MANITFEITGTTTTFTIPRWAPDIKWMQTTSAIVLEFPTTTWKGEAADNGMGIRRVNVIAWGTRTFNAGVSRPTRALCHLKYRAVGELIR